MIPIHNNIPGTLAETIEHQAGLWGDKTFLYFEDNKYSYSELHQLTNKLANGLCQMRVKKGEKVCLMLPNYPNFIFTWFAVQKIGAVMVPINTALKGEGLSYIINHCDAETLVVGYQFWPQIEFIRESLRKVQRIIVDTTEAPSNFQLPKETYPLGVVYDSDDSTPQVELNYHDPGRILYTSGTTGLPKGVVRFHWQGGGLPLKYLSYKPEDVCYTALPLFHGNAENITTLSVLKSGASMALARRFSASRFWEDTKRFNANWTSFLGGMISILYKQPERLDDAINPVQYAFSAAAPGDIWRSFEKRFDLHLHELYGAVDGVGGMFNIDGRVGSMGKPLDDYEAKVIANNDNKLGPHQIGELLMRPKAVEERENMIMYYKNEKAIQEKTKDGWVWSGDLVYYDEDGYFYFVDRKKDALRRRGENISSWEVENVLNQHPNVLESAVFGVPSELGEDDVMAIIVPQKGEKIDPMDLIKWCEKRMAYFMVPRYIELINELPKTGTHRVQKKDLKLRGVTEKTWDLEATDYKLRRPDY